MFLVSSWESNEETDITDFCFDSMLFTTAYDSDYVYSNHDGDGNSDHEHDDDDGDDDNDDGARVQPCASVNLADVMHYPSPGRALRQPCD